VAEDAVPELDDTVARSGRQSLRIRFGGKANVDYRHTSQITLATTPGSYRLQGFVRASGLTTDQGIGLRVFDLDNATRVDVRTDQVLGTTDWKEITGLVQVPRETKQLVVQVVRPRSWKFDNRIAGTAWIDDVSLTRIDE
jgi:hypothetical protein